MIIERSYGKHLKVGFDWVHFVIANPDVMAAVSPNPLRLKQEAPDRYSGAVFGVKVNVRFSTRNLERGAAWCDRFRT